MSIEQDIYDANINDPSEIAVLRMLLEQGTITLDDVTNAMTKKKVAYVKQKHNYDIYVDSRGRWRTYYKEPDDPSSKRRTISKKTEEEVYETLYGLYAHTDERVYSQEAETVTEEARLGSMGTLAVQCSRHDPKRLYQRCYAYKAAAGLCGRA